MSNPIIIAIDAMGGENSPTKILKGIEIHSLSTKDVFYNIFGDQKQIEPLIKKTKISNNSYKIIHTNIVVSNELSAMSSIKKGKDSSMWKSIQAQIDHKADITLSAGNTGVLLVMSKMILKILEDVDKPALAGLWPNNHGMSVVLDLGANIE